MSATAPCTPTPVSSRTYAFPVREVAAAFVAVGTGASHARAADRARVAVGDRSSAASRAARSWPSGWICSPPWCSTRTRRAWPETLVLDNTWCMVENRRTHRQTFAFHVLGAYGYPAGAWHGRVWALHASHRATQADWEAFLRSLDVSEPPKLVIADDNAAIANAVRAVWPATPSPSLPVPFFARCEHHLHVNGVEAMEGDGIGGWAHWLRRRLDTAFLRTEGWDELHEKVAGFASTQAWLTGIASIATQVAVRHLLPAHHSTAALDTALGTVRDFLDSRSFVLRNKRRTNLALGLVRLHLNGVDLQSRYHTLLRQHLDETGGILPAQRAGKDTGVGSCTDRAHRAVASLCG